VLSTTYVLCFLATTAREYGVVVMVLAGLALLGMAGRRRGLSPAA
jgi:hypothetical protein